MQDMRKLLGMKLKCGWTEAKGKKKEKKNSFFEKNGVNNGLQSKWSKMSVSTKTKINK